MQTLIEDFLQFLRHERGQSEHTQKTYSALLNKFVVWARKNGLADWPSVKLSHLTAFLLHERERAPAGQDEKSPRKLSSESVYLEIAALRAFYRFAENEKLLPANVAENLSLPRRWKRLPKSLTDQEITQLLVPEAPKQGEKPAAAAGRLCDQAVLELAYASGLRLAELRNLRLEQLHLDAGFINVIGKGNKERVVPVGPPGRRRHQRLPRSRPAQARHAPFARQPVSHPARHRRLPPRRSGSASNAARGSPASGATSRRTCCGTVSPRICWSTARTCASSRNSSATPASAPRRFTPTSPANASATSTASFIRGGETIRG